MERRTYAGKDPWATGISDSGLGKEIRVFVYRLTKQLELLKKVACSGKFGGATGNFNAHNVAYPEIDWTAFANKFLTEKLKIEREQYTTQISNYDNFATVFDNLRRINNIVVDLIVTSGRISP